MMSEKVPDNVRKQIDGMAEAFRERLMGLCVWSNEEQAGAEPTAMQIEDKIREWIRRIGEDTQVLLLGGMDRNRRKGKTPCPQCGEDEYWKGYEPRQYIIPIARRKTVV